MKKLMISATLLAVSLPSVAADAEQGKAKSAICATCHGAAGIATVPVYPNLAGQQEAYLVSSLKAYKNKERNGGMAAVMQAQAAGLSDEDIADLAAYYASLK
ncbi:c-type cytochrome [Motilimonas pumila]|uniref:Cytochrome c n=1 Tax=Motilimonas pumila TaxID=2303987 RepID=A0A418YFL8_9GAMM|nr:cytochrome c [Motilimonas pumila]RJG47939.1 cytochrome c [Motilimonas pumila]